jgi:hypothetical protein
MPAHGGKLLPVVKFAVVEPPAVAPPLCPVTTCVLSPTWCESESSDTASPRLAAGQVGFLAVVEPPAVAPPDVANPQLASYGYNDGTEWPAYHSLTLPSHYVCAQSDVVRVRVE